MSEQPFGEFRSTGMQEVLSPARARMMREIFDAEYAGSIKRKEHYWIATMMYKILPPLADGMVFDAAMLRMAAFGCFICEEPYSERLRHRTCKGEPKENGRPCT